MAIVRDFTFDEDSDTGMIGLRPAWFANAEPATGMTIAHDMLEHFKTQSEALEGECEALGALLALRLMQGWGGAPGGAYRSPAERLGFEVSTLIVDSVQRDDRPLPRYRTSRPLRDECADEVILEAVSRGLESARGELGEWGGREELEPEGAERMKGAFVAWIRRGYRRTVKRFRHYDLYTIGIDLFDRVTKDVTRLCRSEMLAYGDRVRIGLDLQRALVSIKVNGHCAYDFGYL